MLPIHYLTLALTTLLAGLTIRFAHLGLPPILVKYGGSALWALMIYWLLAAFLTPKKALPTALALTTAIECLKLYHTPTLDAFRLTIPGVLLLGRFFSLWDLAAYYLAILLGASLSRATANKTVTPLQP